MPIRATRGPTMADNLNANSPVPLYLQIEELVRNKIERGDLAPLDRIASEISLAKEYGVSRMTARKAVDRLVADGWVFRQPGKGTFVAHAKIEHGLSTQLSFSRRMRELGLVTETRVLQATAATAPLHVAHQLGSPPDGPVIIIRRLRLVSGEPAALHTAYLPRRYSAILHRDLSGSLTEAMEAVGARVVHARDHVDSVLADQELGQLLGVEEGRPLVRVEGLALSGNREPLRWTEAYYRADRFRFTVDTSGPADLQLELKQGSGPVATR